MNTLPSKPKWEQRDRCAGVLKAKLQSCVLNERGEDASDACLPCIARKVLAKGQIGVLQNSFPFRSKNRLILLRDQE